MSKGHLDAARRAKNDEFYTQYSDIENELQHYKNHFKDKVVFCNCDGPRSNFIKYFQDNFIELGLKSLLTSSYDVNTGAGDFRSAGLIDMLKEADIVCTNPPFSLFREYMAQLIKYKKKFLIMGNMGAVIYKDIFPLIKENKIWLGINSRINNFILPDGSLKNMHNVEWFTNLVSKKEYKVLELTKTYYGNEKDYPKYDNYDAINVNKVKDIPMDYFGVMGVPITFIAKHHPEQFGLLEELNPPIIDGKPIFKRVLIKRIQEPFEILDCCEPSLDLETLKQNPDFKEYKSRQIIFKGKLCQKTYHRILIKRKPEFEIIDMLNRYSVLDGPTEETKGIFLNSINGKPIYTRILIKRKDTQ